MRQLTRFQNNAGVFQFGHMPYAGQLISNNNTRNTTTLLSYYKPLVTIVDYSKRGKTSRLLIWPNSHYSNTDLVVLQTWLGFFNVTSFRGNIIDAKWLLTGDSNDARIYTDMWGKAIVCKVHSYQPYNSVNPDSYRRWAELIY